jgi:uncharacterized protein
MFDNNGLEIISAEESLLLLLRSPIGRIAFTHKALPAIQPVNFALDNGAIVIRTTAGSKLEAAARNAVVAFEVDEYDLDYHRGWSVNVVGRAHLVTDPAEVLRLSRLPLRPWASGERDSFIRIPIRVIHGRRILPPGQRPNGLGSDDIRAARTALKRASS